MEATAAGLPVSKAATAGLATPLTPGFALLLCGRPAALLTVTAAEVIELTTPAAAAGFAVLPAGFAVLPAGLLVPLIMPALLPGTTAPAMAAAALGWLAAADNVPIAFCTEGRVALNKALVPAPAVLLCLDATAAAMLCRPPAGKALIGSTSLVLFALGTLALLWVAERSVPFTGVACRCAGCAVLPGLATVWVAGCIAAERMRR